MEARRYGFDPSLPPAFKFDPTDADIVAHYLLPRAVGLPNRHAHAVIDDDPASCPPWELMRRHAHADSDQAFFFAPALPTTKTRPNRVVLPGEYGAGGKWRGQKGQDEDIFLVRGGAGGDEIKLRYKRYNLTFYGKDEDRTSGWVMHEYLITDPSLRPAAVFARVRFTDTANKERRQQQQIGPARQVVPYQEQPGPSNYLGDGPIAGNAVVPSDGEGTSGGGEQIVVVHQGDDDGGVVGEPAGYYSALLNAGEDGGHLGDDSNSNCDVDMSYLLTLDDGSGDVSLFGD